ncbi:MAG: OstA-like protein, partial [bacterium]
VNRKVNAQSIRFFEDTGNFDAHGNVEIFIGDSLEVRCETVHYTDSSKILEMSRDLRIIFLRDSSVIYGQWGYFNIRDSTGTIGGNPIYRLPNKKREEPLTIYAQILSFSQPDNWAKFIGEVKLTRGDLFSVSDTLFYQPDSQRIFLSGAPLVWYKRDRMSGKTISLHYEGENLTWANVENEAVVLSPSVEDSLKIHRLAGSHLRFLVIDDSTRLIESWGDAEGQYFIWDGSGVYQGVNICRADTITITIVNGEARSIVIAGKAIGEFYPPGFEPPGVVEKPSTVPDVVRRREE